MTLGKRYEKLLGGMCALLLLLVLLTSCGTEEAQPVVHTHTTQSSVPTNLEQTTEPSALIENTIEPMVSIQGETKGESSQEQTTESVFAEPLPTESFLQIPEIEPVATTQRPGQNEPSLYDYWNRGWYGWWIVEEGDGVYATWGDGSYWWDCCADLILGEDGVLSMTLWDEDGSRQEPMAEVEFCLEPQEGTYGTAYSTDGHFWQSTLTDGEWKLEPNAALYDELLVFEGRYVASEYRNDAFRYTIYLRPWGKLWDDWYADEKNCLPDLYESWYLPKLAQGVTSPPDRIG